ncbi:hypothetical protein [Deinococcus soli (ex Cha et al. 2016)]|uniref:Uncharacterized protein n=2 Tax=Deinococcus soli (ex Cha et al. 2016) TaxID=1309411 RepID=A0ACC6KFR5_9DEIO|nr:hypothetical protein [Deinococcus soli (ex Cha et al. 2016)]MDR6218386.1 hypothetical protein [Deinococcus soli (ex Cha et al. 2016)]MDR6329126.1 hypothetical protein [Deinococcus soli (ex Cha et al. 2016)]MDR6751399.1 hypothetical protein [Deinococcus soli (ex Cha et al. 2016)]
MRQNLKKIARSLRQNARNAVTPAFAPPAERAAPRVHPRYTVDIKDHGTTVVEVRHNVDGVRTVYLDGTDLVLGTVSHTEWMAKGDYGALKAVVRTYIHQVAAAA